MILSLLLVLLLLLTLVLRPEREALALDLFEFSIDPETLILTLALRLSLLTLFLPLPLALTLLLGLCLFQALRERLSDLGDLLAVNEQITPLAGHRNVSVRDVRAAVIRIDRPCRMATLQELPDEPPRLLFELALGNIGFRIGRNLKLALELVAIGFLNEPPNLSIG